MRGLLWLLGAVLLLGSTDGGDTYEQLDAKTRHIIDQAIIKANEEYGKKHMDFDSVICSDSSRFNVILKPTSCDKGQRVHRNDCTLQDKLKPWVSCVACGENIACKPIRNNKENIENLKKKCGSECHLPGREHILFSKGEAKEYGCLGCI